MRRLLFIALLPFSALADEESLHTLNMNLSQYDETLSVRDISQEISPTSLGAAYTYISPEGLVLRGNIWHESADETVNGLAELERSAWGGGVSFAYPVEELELELSYSHSRPELEIYAGPNNYLEEDSETHEFALGASTYYYWGGWSFTPSLQLGYQDTETNSNERMPSALFSPAVTVSSSSRESGWFASPTAGFAYLFELNNQTTFSPLLTLSWTEFFQGEGVVRRTAYGRGTSRSGEEELASSSDGSGLVSIGANLSIADYYVDFSIDESIDLPDVGTQVNLGFGIVW